MDKQRLDRIKNQIKNSWQYHIYISLKNFSDFAILSADENKLEKRILRLYDKLKGKYKDIG